MHSGPEEDSSPSTWDRLAALPDIDAEPIDADWLAPSAPAAPQSPHVPAEPQASAPPPPPAPGPVTDPRRIHVRAGGATASPTDPEQRADPVPAPWIEPEEPDEPVEPPLRRRPRRRRRTGLIVALVLVPLMAVGGFLLYSWVLWEQVDRIDTEGALTAGGADFTNYLIVGTDSREGVDASLDTADQIGLGVRGNRSDTMVLLHVSERGNRILSLPRDLWVDIADGGAGKLNAATAVGGPPTLIRTVQQSLGVLVHHYLEVDIAGFLSVIESVGSISIQFAAPACDPKSGLDVRQTGNVALGPEMALAYVRSRTYTEFDAAPAAGLDCAQLRSAGLGTEVGVADFGRTERQRRFLVAVFDKVSSTRNPVTVLRVLSGLGDGLRIDDSMGMWDAVGLLREMRGLDADSSPLPVQDFAAPDGSSALRLSSEAQAVLDSVR